MSLHGTADSDQPLGRFHVGQRFEHELPPRLLLGNQYSIEPDIGDADAERQIRDCDGNAAPESIVARDSDSDRRLRASLELDLRRLDLDGQVGRLGNCDVAQLVVCIGDALDALALQLASTDYVQRDGMFKICIRIGKERQDGRAFARNNGFPGGPDARREIAHLDLDRAVETVVAQSRHGDGRAAATREIRIGRRDAELEIGRSFPHDEAVSIVLALLSSQISQADEVVAVIRSSEAQPGVLIVPGAAVVVLIEEDPLRKSVRLQLCVGRVQAYLVDGSTERLRFRGRVEVADAAVSKVDENRAVVRSARQSTDSENFAADHDVVADTESLFLR